MMVCFFLVTVLIVENLFFIKILRQRSDLLNQSYRMTEKFQIYFEVTTEWCIGNMKGKRVSEWIQKNGYTDIAIYGMGALGKMLFMELQDNEDVHVKYGLDRSKIQTDGICVYNLNEPVEKVELIVVTAVTAYEEIKKEIEEKIEFSCRVISLVQLVEEMFTEGDGRN